jgi:MFS family permease
VADIIGNRPAFVISYAITTVILVWGLVARDLWELYLFGIVFGFGWGAQAVLRHAITSEVFGLVSLAVVMAVLGIAEASASAFGAYFAGYIFDVAGSYQPTFSMGVAVSTTGILLTWLLKPKIRKSK